jgi:hypothetical protein
MRTLEHCPGGGNHPRLHGLVPADRVIDDGLPLHHPDQHTPSERVDPLLSVSPCIPTPQPLRPHAGRLLRNIVSGRLPCQRT